MMMGPQLVKAAAPPAFRSAEFESIYVKANPREF